MLHSILVNVFDRPACPPFGRQVSTVYKIVKAPKSPVPPAGEAEMRQHLGVRGVTPAGVQRAAPSGARRIGAGVQRAAPSGARRIGAGVQRAAPSGARRIGAGVRGQRPPA